MKKTKEQLEQEILELRGHMAELERTLAEQKRVEAELKSMSFTDELTGLYNRRGFFALADQQLKMARRLKKGVLILYADLDNLKTINDTLGHHEGNRAITDTASVLNSTYRDSDIIARIGGDEFVVFPVGTTDDNVRVIEKRLQRCIDEHNERNERPYKLSMSFGIKKCNPSVSLSLEEMLTEADEMMYEQKRKKKNHSRPGGEPTRADSITLYKSDA